MAKDIPKRLLGDLEQLVRIKRIEAVLDRTLKDLSNIKA
jgi:hypothetical protein